MMRYPYSIILPLILAGAYLAAAKAAQSAPLPGDMHGFIDARAGMRTGSDPGYKEDSLGETRLQLEKPFEPHAFSALLRADLLYDWTGNDFSVDLENGEGWIDLREAYLLFSPHPLMDAKPGRQILTWGTGDLLFINDLFPKDWVSFLSGRDEEYLKAPSDAVLLSLFPSWAAIDLVYTPRFDADRFISGERLSFYSPAGGVIRADRPDRTFSDDELALRASRTAGAFELAAYAYHGFWKSPGGFDPENGRAVFPRLQVFGASARGPAAGGILNVEAGRYDSRDDPRGDNPLILNGQWRALAGFQREMARNLTAGLQYYLEHMDHYAKYRQTLPAGAPAGDENRQLATLRLTHRLLNQNLTLSLFTFWSPTDQDAYLRPTIAYKATDAWLVTAGANFFEGEDRSTFFGQFENNSNVYVGARYSF